MLTAIIASGAWKVIAAAIGAFGTILAGFLMGRNSGKKAAELQRMKDGQDTAERINDAIVKSHDGGSSWVDRLRK